MYLKTFSEIVKSLSKLAKISVSVYEYTTKSCPVRASMQTPYDCNLKRKEKELILQEKDW